MDLFTFFPAENESTPTIRVTDRITIFIFFRTAAGAVRTCSIIVEQQPRVGRVGSTVNDPQQGSGESEQLKEAVETKVDEMSGQAHHLQR